MSGKAQSLAELKRLGLNVPEWFVIPHNKSVPKVLKNIKSFAEFYAVRSSAVAEDGLHHSFAGLFTTRLNVTWENVPIAISECRASAQTLHVKDYAARADIPEADLAVNVIIQKMIQPRVAGVLFTALPDGNINQMIVEAAPGLGVAVVDGQVPVERWVYYKIEKHWLNTANPYSTTCLSQLDLAELVAAVEKIEKSQIGFFDLEFAFDKKLWVLQKRPITTLSGKKVKLYDGANIQENYPRLNTPLTFCALRRGYEANFTQLLTLLGIKADELQRLSPALSQMVEPIQGHFYYRLDHWYQIFQVIPGLAGSAIKAFQSMIGTGVRDVQLSVKADWKSGFALIIEMIKGLIFRDSMERSYRERMNIIKAEAQQAEGTAMQPLERWHWAKNWMEKTYAILYYPLLNDFYCGVFLYVLNLRMKAKQFDLSLINELVMGIDEIESARCVHEAQHLASIISRDIALRNKLKNIKFDHEAVELINQSSHFAIHAKEYLDRFGERTIEEMKLEVPGFSERPRDFLHHLVKMSDSIFVQEDQSQKNKRRTDAWEQWRCLPFSFIERTLMNILLRQYIRALAFREESRFDRVRGKGPFRRAAIAMGDELKKQGLISNRDDVFWLEFTEIENREFTLALIEQRKQLWHTTEKLPQRFAMLEGVDVPLVSQPLTSVSDLQGLGCSGGETEGVCIVISHHQETQDVSGKILVAESTDPGWVFLMMQAKGLIVERGNLLSHAAIIGRELGIPTVIGVQGACARLKDKFIRFNGKTGVIEILEKNETHK